MTSNIVLTPDQKEATTKFLRFLLSKNQKEFYLFGSAGCGKTFLTRYFLTYGMKTYQNSCKILAKTPVYNTVYVTATTNKATEVLEQHLSSLNLENPPTTIYSLLNIVVGENYYNGKTYLKDYQPNKILRNAIIFVDECSMLPKRMIEFIHKKTSNCKIVYIGDNYQLAPVNEKIYWDKTPEKFTAVLSTPVRNKNQQPLVDLCKQLRDTIDTQQFKDIKLCPGVIDLLTDDQAYEWLEKADYTKARVLSFTNTVALKYIDWISSQKDPNLPLLANGRIYTNNCNFEYRITPVKTIRFYPEELVQISGLSNEFVYTAGSKYSFKTRRAVVRSLSVPGKAVEAGAMISTDPADLKKLIKQADKDKDFTTLFFLQKEVMDLRLPYASTIHKAQGNTYDEVYVDLSSFSTCKSPDVLARLLYVAVSRARNRVVFHGSLPSKYGELV